jgi:hypothetical protein
MKNGKEAPLIGINASFLFACACGPYFHARLGYDMASIPENEANLLIGYKSTPLLSLQIP